MSQVQVIEKDGVPAFYVVPAALWARIREQIEDAEDAAAFDKAVKGADGFTIPLAVAKAQLEGAHPVRAWRDHRGLSGQALADAAGVSKAYVSQIEGGSRVGTAATLKKLAAALGVPLDVLTE